MGDAPSPSEIVDMVEREGSTAVNRLAQMEFSGKIDALCRALALAQSPRTRRVLANMFASLADPEALPCLLAALDDDAPEVISAAADAIGNSAYGNELPPDLQEALGTRLIQLVHEDLAREQITPAALYGLGLMRYAGAFSTFVAALSSPTPMVRWNAAEALAHLGDVAGKTHLERALKQETDKKAQQYMNTALEILGESSQKQHKSGNTG